MINVTDKIATNIIDSLISRSLPDITITRTGTITKWVIF